MRRFVLTIVIFFFASEGLAALPAFAHADPQVARGACMPTLAVGPNVLNDFEIKAYDSINSRAGASPQNHLKRSDGRVRALEHAVQNISFVSKGQLDSVLKGSTFYFGRTGDYSRQTTQGIQINPARFSSGGGYRGTNNVGLMTHEIGHKVGNSGWYAKYTNHMGKKPRCALSNYATTSTSNDAFSEVFTAYMLNPGLFASANSESCNHAFEFFKKEFNEQGLQKTCESRKSSNGQRSRNLANQPAQQQTVAQTIQRSEEEPKEPEGEGENTKKRSINVGSVLKAFASPAFINSLPALVLIKEHLDDDDEPEEPEPIPRVPRTNGQTPGVQ